MIDSLRCLLAVAALSTALLRAQAEAPDIRDFRTEDGSRFVLVPDGGPPVVHWVMATPAGALEDPSGLEGLSYAVARAAMAGTSATRSTDSAKEALALAELDGFEQRYDELRAAEQEIPDDLQQSLTAARQGAAAHFDAVGWDRDLRRSPALRAALHTAPDATLLHVTTSVRGLVPVARLLVERREGALLRGVHLQFRQVRAEMQLQRADEARAEIRREVLGLSFLGHPYARAWAPVDRPRPLSASLALEVFRRTHDPGRTVHVLTGGFDADEVRTRLERIFARSAVPRVPVAVAPTPPAIAGDRRATIPGARFPVIAIGWSIPAGVDRDALAVLVRWLGDAENGTLVGALRQRGHQEAAVAVSAPFPAQAANLLLLEVEDPVPPRTGAPSLLASVERSLEELLDAGPRPTDVELAWSRVRAERAASRLGSENLAYQLALACGAGGLDPNEVLREPAAVDLAAIHDLARRILAVKSRTVVTLEPVL